MQTIKVDARRLLCPMPVIRLQDAMEPLPVGSQVIITCTDPGVKNDIPAWSRINGQSVLNIQEQDHEIIITVQKDSNE
ncbi:MAG: sulfurtransferase TusA family protein [Gammaproteobacteria bacterium]|nr:sulfurtransferase TusA family protein [Gammaproteobacteria bacterium]MBL7000275.1 sulfurtransferase TusA family protein [Gammaproteobacteria bacterium]